jgi:hypothetical protein
MRRWIWPLITFGWLVPIYLTSKWMIVTEAGTGPKGGEAVVLLFIMATMGLSFCTLVNGFLRYRGRPAAGVAQHVGRALGLFGGVVTGLVILFIMLDKATSMVTADGFDLVGWMGVGAVLLAFVLFNLMALRQHAQAEGRRP